MVAAASVSESAPVTALNCARCNQPAVLQCPKCVEQRLPKADSAFCSQDCFKASWAEHKRVHVKAARQDWLFCTKRGRGRSKSIPSFEWTGDLRPYPISPTRQVPSGIPRPDWSDDGQPKEEPASRMQTVVPVHGPKALEGIRAACLVSRRILDAGHAAVRPGVTTDEIDRVVHEATIAEGAYPSPLNYYGFPKSVCTSVNEVICHGIPDQRPLQEGDIINVDVSAMYKGYHGDLNETYLVGNADEKTKTLVSSAYQCMMNALSAVKPGVRYREMGAIISKHADTAGLAVVKTYCGHGIGTQFHCAPSIPHYRGNKAIGVMKVGQVFTVEPMINEGSWRDVTWPDGWTSVTSDGKRSAQFEHSVVVTETGCDILTARLPSSPLLHWEAGWKPREASPTQQTSSSATADSAKSGPGGSSTDVVQTENGTTLEGGNARVARHKDSGAIGSGGVH